MSALYDLEAEEKLLGGLLDDGDILAVADIVQATDFYGDRNQHIYDAVIRIFNENSRISPATVATELQRSGHGDVLETTLEELRAQAITSFSAAEVGVHANTIRDHAKNRQLKAALERALQTVGDPKQTPEQKLDAAQHAVMNLAAHQSDPDIADGAALAKAAAERLERRRKALDGLMGLSWGLRDLDRVTGGLQGGMLYVFGARPSMGKTWLGLAAASNTALTLNKPTLFVSLEMSRDSVAERIAACEAGLNAKELINATPEQAKRYHDALTKLETSPLFVDDSSTTPITALGSRARKLHHSAPLGLIVVDYLQLIDTADADSSSTRATQVSKLSRGLKKSLSH